jgi:hypothetical protein
MNLETWMGKTHKIRIRGGEPSKLRLSTPYYLQKKISIDSSRRSTSTSARKVQRERCSHVDTTKGINHNGHEGPQRNAGFPLWPFVSFVVSDFLGQKLNRNTPTPNG